MDKEELEKQLKESEERMKAYADGAAERYTKANTWWQRYRREHPLAVQNLLVFVYGPSLFALGCFLTKVFLK